jgi:JmjC domain, hydroxylase/C5HC2 zinc finger
MESPKRFQTKQQQLHRLQEGISFDDGEEYTAAEYQKQASKQVKEWKEKHYPEHDFMEHHAGSLVNNGDDEAGRKIMSPANLERDYWDIVETHNREMSVEYGNDVDTTTFGSGFPLSERGRAISGTINPEKVNAPEPLFGEPDYYKETWWNLNNIPSAPDSVLRHVRVGINGINVPWMYHGCLFSSFCWHNEDNYLYSVNYHHRGAPKQWYGVPGTKKDSDGLEKVFKGYLSMKMRDVPDLLHHITTMFSPRLLQQHDVNAYKILQHEGEFVVTFPRAFHGGFSLGPNVGEAVNFATHDWIALGSDANERYRSFARPAVFSHDRLTFTMANHLKSQKCYRTCNLLLKELERVVKEELHLREELVKQGVRDVSNVVNLPQNRLDQLDEESADYDDKRLCHGCKHVCFFSAVACECSQSKVSCLRHSHYMCRCPRDRRYLLIWSTAKEMTDTLNDVREYCNALFKKEAVGEDTTKKEDDVAEVTPIAPGIKEDLALHKNDKLKLEAVTGDPNYRRPDSFERPDMKISRTILCVGGKSGSQVISDEDGPSSSNASDEKDSSEEEEPEHELKVKMVSTTKVEPIIPREDLTPTTSTATEEVPKEALS